MTTRGFGSDNQAGAHPRILAALAAANAGHEPAYGGDAYTARLNEEVAPLFGPEARIYPAFGGTGANVTAIAAMCSRWQAVLCAPSAHLTQAEAGALEAMVGVKAVHVRAQSGKVTPSSVDEALATLGGLQQVEPAVLLSLTQPTEVGTLYHPAELAELVSHAHRHGLRVHVDGARISNAAAALDCGLSALTGDVGVDVLTLGGAKNGLVFGEAIVVLDAAAAPRLLRAQKAFGQLPSKQRYLSAQLLELFGTSLWRELAVAANSQARRLEALLTETADIEVLYPVETNSVFVRAPAPVATVLVEQFGSLAVTVPEPAVRLVTSWDTEAADVDRLVAAVESAGR